MKIIKITHNWLWSPVENSTGCEEFEVGKDGVIEIEEHPAMGEGDKFYYYIRYQDGTEMKIFNPNTVTLK